MKYAIIIFSILAFFAFLGFLYTASQMVEMANEEAEEIPTGEETPKTKPE